MPVPGAHRSQSTPDRQPLGPAPPPVPGCPLPPRGWDGTALPARGPPPAARMPPPCHPAPRASLPRRCPTCPRGANGVRPLPPRGEAAQAHTGAVAITTPGRAPAETDAAISPLLSSPLPSSPLPVCGAGTPPSVRHTIPQSWPWTGDPIRGSDLSPATLCGIKLLIAAGSRHCEKIHLAKEQGPTYSERVPDPWSQVPWKAMTCLCTLVCSFPPGVEAGLGKGLLSPVPVLQG